MAVFNVQTVTPGSGQAKYVYDAAMTNGSSHVTSASNPWTSGDVGKTIHLGGSFSSAIVPLTGVTITAFNSAGDVTISSAATFGATSCYCAWGLDDTAAFTAAQSAAVAAGLGNTVLVPAGNYIVTNRVCNSALVNFIGEGSGSTFLLPQATLPAPVDGSGALIEFTGSFLSIGGFSVIGPKVVDFAFAQQQAFVRLKNGLNVRAYDIRSLYMGSAGGGTICVDFVGQSNLVVDRLYVQHNPALGTSSVNMTGVRFYNCYGDVYNLVSSNHGPHNLWIDTNLNGTGGFGGPAGVLNFHGGLIDETAGGGYSCQLVTTARANFYGMNLWAPGGSPNYAVYVDGTSEANFDTCVIQPFGVQSQTCMLIDAGGVVRASKSILGGGFANKSAIVNNGKFIDCGGNKYVNGLGGTYVQIPWRAVFTNPNAVIQSTLEPLWGFPRGPFDW